MAKTDLTLEIEEALRQRNKSKCERYAFEVPIGKGICDMVTTKILYENHCIPWVTCYEIKVSMSDYWNSDNGANFEGDENYYVMPKELIEEIIAKGKQTKIPNGVGVISYNGNHKLRKKTDGVAHRWSCNLTLTDKFKLMDTMLMRILSTGQ